MLRVAAGITVVNITGTFSQHSCCRGRSPMLQPTSPIDKIMIILIYVGQSYVVSLDCSTPYISIFIAYASNITNWVEKTLISPHNYKPEHCSISHINNTLFLTMSLVTAQNNSSDFIYVPLKLHMNDVHFLSSPSLMLLSRYRNATTYHFSVHVCLF